MKDLNNLKLADKPGELTSKSPVIRQRLTEVILGRQSANCKKFGICRIESVHPMKAFNYSSEVRCCEKIVYAIASLKEKKFFELAFLRSTVNQVVFKQYFKNRVFTMGEPYRIEEDLIGTSIDLMEGLYNITITETFLFVRFDLIKGKNNYRA